MTVLAFVFNQLDTVG